MTTVTLTQAQMFQAAVEGCMRQLRAFANGRRHRHGHDGTDNWTMHIEAAGAEVAVARLTGRFWCASFLPDYAGDIGVGLQVRHTARATGRLILHPTDDDRHVFVLARGLMPEYDLAGWIVARDGKRLEWWRELQPGRGAYVVEACHLRPMEEL